MATGFRHEFRVWALDLAELRGKLERLAVPTRTASQETYLVSRATDRCNAKIRSGLMDIKILIAEERGLQQWKPVLKAGFPLDTSVIATEIFPDLELPPRLPRAQYSIDEFLDEVIRAEAGIAIADVSKTRLQFGLGACQAEFASVMVNAAALDTVAVESTDPDAVLDLVRDFGLHPESNTSYVTKLKRILERHERQRPRAAP